MTHDRPSRLVRMVGNATTADLAISADSTFAELAPLLARAIGADSIDDGDRIVHDGRPAEPGQTPSSIGVVDGDQLELSTGAGPFPPPAPPAPPAPTAPTAPVPAFDDVRRRRFGTAAG